MQATFANLMRITGIRARWALDVAEWSRVYDHDDT